MREFHAPLVALTYQLNTMASVKKQAVCGRSEEEDYDLTTTFYDKFFLPIQEEINGISKSKVHLLEGAMTPPRFARYFEHYASELAYWQLVQAGKDVRHMDIPGSPREFYYDVRRRYQAVLDHYEQSLDECAIHAWGGYSHYDPQKAIVTTAAFDERPPATPKPMPYPIIQGDVVEKRSLQLEEPYNPNVHAGGLYNFAERKGGDIV